MMSKLMPVKTRAVRTMVSSAVVVPGMSEAMTKVKPEVVLPRVQVPSRMVEMVMRSWLQTKVVSSSVSEMWSEVVSRVEAESRMPFERVISKVVGGMVSTVMSGSAGEGPHRCRDKEGADSYAQKSRTPTQFHRVRSNLSRPPILFF